MGSLGDRPDGAFGRTRENGVYILELPAAMKESSDPNAAVKLVIELASVVRGFVASLSEYTLGIWASLRVIERRTPSSKGIMVVLILSEH